MAIYEITAYGRKRFRVRYKAFDDAMKIAKRSGIRVVKQSTDTLAKFCDEYLERLAKHDLAAITIDVYQQEWKKWIKPRARRLQAVYAGI